MFFIIAAPNVLWTLGAVYMGLFIIYKLTNVNLHDKMNLGSEFPHTEGRATSAFKTEGVLWTPSPATLPVITP